MFRLLEVFGCKRTPTPNPVVMGQAQGDFSAINKLEAKIAVLKYLTSAQAQVHFDSPVAQVSAIEDVLFRQENFFNDFHDNHIDYNSQAVWDSLGFEGGGVAFIRTLQKIRHVHDKAAQGGAEELDTLALEALEEFKKLVQAIERSLPAPTSIDLLPG